MLEEECLDHQDQVINAYLEDCTEKETNELENISSEDNKEFDLESLQIHQERMVEYSMSCKGSVREYNFNDLFFHLYKQEGKLYKMKCEYDKNPIDDILL